MVCVVFRASPLIWPTLSGAHQAPRPLYRCTPVVFRAGLWVLLPSPYWGRPIGRRVGGEGLRSHYCFLVFRVFHHARTTASLRKDPLTPAPLPHWGRGEKTCSPRIPLPQAVPAQRPYSSVGAQDGASRGEIGSADAPRARLLTPQLAQKELSGGSNVSEAKLRAVPSQENGLCASVLANSKTPPMRPEMRALPRHSNDCRAPAHRWHCQVLQPRPSGLHCRGPDRH